MEKIIDCPVCYDADQCFEEVQEKYSSFLCFRYQLGSLELVYNLKKSPKLVQETKFEDKTRNIAWFPSVINMGELGMIFPQGTPEEYVWKYAKVIEIPESDQVQYNNYTKRLDVENAMTFGQYEFMEACEEMGITRDMKRNA